MSTSTTLSRKVDARLTAYTALAGAVLASTATMLPEAKASIVYSGPVSLNVPATTSGIYLNLVTGVSSTSPTTAIGWDFNPWGTSLNFFYPTNTPANGGLTLNGTSFAVLTPSDVIGSASTFLASSATATAMAAYRAGETGGYLGIRFLNEATGATNYGWIQINTTATTGFPATITGFAYENTGGAITAGAIPEPSTLALLGAMAAGAAGVREWRRRRTA